MHCLDSCTDQIVPATNAQREKSFFSASFGGATSIRLPPDNGKEESSVPSDIREKKGERERQTDTTRSLMTRSQLVTDCETIVKGST